jgi:ribosomal protein S18 acetylase RimI-like enzyme
LAKRIMELALEKRFEIMQLYVLASNRQAIHVYKKLASKRSAESEMESNSRLVTIPMK